MSSPVRLWFEFEADVNADAAQQELKTAIDLLPNVERAQVVKSEPRMTGAEIAVLIGAGIVVANQAKNAIDALTDLTASLAKLVREIKGLKSAIVETPTGRRNLEDLSESDLQALIEVDD